MKRIIRLVFAVVLGLTVFSATASAEEIVDYTDYAETAVSTVTDTGEAVIPEEPLYEETVPQEADSAEDSAEETGSEAPLPGSVVAEENEDVVRALAGNTDETSDETPDETPDSNPDEEPGENPPSDGTETGTDSENETGDVPPDTALTDDEKQDNPDDFVIRGENIPLDNGMYSYELIVKPDGRLTFDNYLENIYQGVDGKYKLHYEIEESDNHIMRVAGIFKNILIASPLIKFQRDKISEDSYFYLLDLRTNEGFSFINNLRYLFNGEKHGFSVYYDYNIAEKKQIIKIGKPRDEEEEAELWQQNKLQQNRRSMFSYYLPYLSGFEKRLYGR